MSSSVEQISEFLQALDEHIKFERERSALFPKPGQTIKVFTTSARGWMQDKIYLVGQRTAAGINIWRLKTNERGQMIVEIEDKRICGLCGRDGENVHYHKCGHCRRIRYCGKGCQRAHWREHKAVCEPREA